MKGLRTNSEHRRSHLTLPDFYIKKTNTEEEKLDN